MAQTANGPVAGPPVISESGTTNAVPSGISTIWADGAAIVQGLPHLTNYSFNPYGTYAPAAPKGNRFGGGFLMTYNVSQHVGLSLGVDYLGHFSMTSGNATLKADVYPARYLGMTGSITNFYATPFALAGLGAPTGGTGGLSSTALITDVGINIPFGHLWGGKFNVGAAYGEWMNAGVYSVHRYHFFAGWQKGF